MPKPPGKSIPPADKVAAKEVKIDDWLGTPVLIPGEDPATYAQLSTQLRRAFGGRQSARRLQCAPARAQPEYPG